jgi:hypothetical protein
MQLLFSFLSKAVTRMRQKRYGHDVHKEERRCASILSVLLKTKVTNLSSPFKSISALSMPKVQHLYDQNIFSRLMLSGQLDNFTFYVTS